LAGLPFVDGEALARVLPEINGFARHAFRFNEPAQ
jgi:hypothetical protein